MELSKGLPDRITEVLALASPVVRSPLSPSPARLHTPRTTMSSAGGGVADAPTPQNARVAMLRLASDLRAILEDPPAGVSASPVTEDNLFTWNATIVGPEESPWEGALRARRRRRSSRGRVRDHNSPRALSLFPCPSGGLFLLRLQFPDQYPDKAPRVKFVSEMFHPNIFSDGNLCLDIIQEKWKPIYTVSSILASVQSLLCDPNTESPANADAARLFLADRKAYNKRVRAAAARPALLIDGLQLLTLPRWAPQSLTPLPFPTPLHAKIGAQVHGGVTQFLNCGDCFANGARRGIGLACLIRRGRSSAATASRVSEDSEGADARASEAIQLIISVFSPTSGEMTHARVPSSFVLLRAVVRRRLSCSSAQGRVCSCRGCRGRRSSARRAVAGALRSERRRWRGRERDAHGEG